MLLLILSDTLLKKCTAAYKSSRIQCSVFFLLRMRLLGYSVGSRTLLCHDQFQYQVEEKTDSDSSIDFVQEKVVFDSH